MKFNAMIRVSALALLAQLGVVCTVSAEPVEATPGKTLNMVFLPKMLGNPVFEEAYEGAKEARAELDNKGELVFTAPTPENSVAGQIEMITTATTQKQDVIMLSNNTGDQVAAVAEAAQAAGTRIVTWDSPILSGKGESVFIAQVDFGSIGGVMADMAYDVMGGAGEFAILSATPDAANQNAWIASLIEALKDEKYKDLKLVDTVYGDDQSEKSYNTALALVDKHPDLKLIVSPTTVGIAAAAKAMQDEQLCDEVKVSGLGLPADMKSYTLNGCAPQFALWSFVDLGYLTYYASYLIGTGALKGEVGEEFVAGRMGTFKIEEDPSRPGARRVLMGPFTVYTKENIDQ